MKKILFFVFLVFSFGIYSEEFSEADKKSVLKQFSDFQKAVKKKDAVAISKYIAYPLKDGNTKEIIWKNSRDLAKDLKDPEAYVFYSINELKVNYNTNKIINVEERLLQKNEEFGDEFLSVEGLFLDPQDEGNDVYYSGINDEENMDKSLFAVEVSVYDDMFEGGTYYLFTLKNNQLKLISVFQLP